MTVQELINKLQKIKNKDLEVVVKGSSPDGDWEYHNVIEGVKSGKFWDDCEDEEVKAFIIDAGTF